MLDYEEISKKAQFIDNIINYLRGTTGNNFQNNVGIVLREYYKFKNINYIMPEAMRGDYKNDGYLKDEAIFYMIYSPISHIDNVTKDIQEKFESDLSGLLNNVYNKGMWNGIVKKTIFLVNNIDKRLPPDQNGFFEETVIKYQEEYKIEFENQVMDLYDFKTYLEEMPLDLLIRITNYLNISSTVNFNVPNALDIIETISCIANQCNQSILKFDIEDYTRISTPKKIQINNLQEKEQEINAILDKAKIVENVIREMHQDIKQSHKFLVTRQYIIELYKELSEEYSGVELYNLMIERTLETHKCQKALEIPLKFLIVYIFDKCDIFEKE